MNTKYCDDHTCWHNPKDGCPKCEAGEPGFVRHRSQINPQDKNRIADLEKRGLIT